MFQSAIQQQSKNGVIKYPVSLIMRDYNKLYNQLMSSDFFKQYLAENNERTVSLIYDDNSCFTEKSKEFALDDCNLVDTTVDFETAIFISLRNEHGNISDGDCYKMDSSLCGGIMVIHLSQ
jgi:hypothetical protein